MFDFDKNTGEIWIYDVIGPAWAGMIDAGSVIGALKAMGGRDVTLRVSSPGGSVWDAVDIYNAIERYSGRVVAEVDALAASAASFLILAADEVRAAKNAMVMIHQASTMTFGNAEAHQKTIEVLSKADNILVEMYAKKTGKPEAEIVDKLKAETWFTAKEALEFGLIDSIGGVSSVTAQVPEGLFNNVPEFLRVKPEAGTRTAYPEAREAAKLRMVAEKLRARV